MERDTQTKFAALLRAAAAQKVSEDDFWAQFKDLVDPSSDPIAGIAYETATHYWGNFHSRSILFLIPRKPDRGQLEQGRNELNLIADALENELPVNELERRLKDV
jgi:hypothetical protein